MRKRYALQSTPSGWQFESETVLEDFVWDHLEALFGYEPLRRQHHAEGNYCDILAIAPSRQLVIIELKNAEDRYVVQQLTRYYHKLQQVKPFSDRVDYHQPIILMALSSQLHEDNAIDALYHQLNFQLLTFQIQVNENQGLMFHLIDWKDRTCIRSVNIDAISSNDLGNDEIDVPPPPRTFLNRLAKSTKINPQECLDVRARLLQLDPRIKEVKYDNSSYLYGLGKTNFLGGILFHPSTHKNSDVLWPRLMLRLPVKSRKGQSTLSRCLIPNVFITESDAAEGYDFLTGVIHAGTSINGKRTSEVIWMHIFLWNFLRRETQEGIDLKNLISHLKAYCDRKNWPDPTVNREAALGVISHRNKAALLQMG